LFGQLTLILTVFTFLIVGFKGLLFRVVITNSQIRLNQDMNFL